MKIFAFIMAFLVLAQSMLPCADQDLAVDGNKAKTEITKPAKQGNSAREDACSPFCHCTCCAGVSVNHLISSIDHLIPYGDKLITAFLPARTFEIALPIWQPPQLS